MKKLISLTLALISVFVFAACTAEAPHTDPAYPAPWCTNTINADLAYEKCTYSITKTDKETGTVIATGTAVFELSPAGNANDISLSKLDMSTTITYNDQAPDIDKGKTDTITSSVTFSSKSLSPFYSERTVTIADREGVTDNPGYSLINDYTNEFKSILKNSKGEVKHTISFKGENLVGVMDNELMFYYVRAYPSLTNSTYGSFKLADFYDMHSRGSWSPIQMKFSCNEEGKDEAISLPSLSGDYLSDNSVTALKASVAINADLSGPPIQLAISKTPFAISEGVQTSKVIVRIRNTQYNVASASVKYETDYLLSGYTTVNE